MITVGMLAKISRMHIRDKLSIREIGGCTNLSRNTVRQWLKSPEMSEPKYPERRIVSFVDPFKQSYFDAWLEIARLNPDILFWAFTKSAQFWIKRIDTVPAIYIGFSKLIKPTQPLLSTDLGCCKDMQL
jgi:hypothetical protein